MDDFDIDALDNIDFDGVVEGNETRQAEKDAKEAADIAALKDGGDECEGGACKL